MAKLRLKPRFWMLENSFYHIVLFLWHFTIKQCLMFLRRMFLLSVHLLSGITVGEEGEHKQKLCSTNRRKENYIVTNLSKSLFQWGKKAVMDKRFQMCDNSNISCRNFNNRFLKNNWKWTARKLEEKKSNTEQM